MSRACLALFLLGAFLGMAQGRGLRQATPTHKPSDGQQPACGATGGPCCCASTGTVPATGGADTGGPCCRDPDAWCARVNWPVGNPPDDTGWREDTRCVKPPSKVKNQPVHCAAAAGIAGEDVSAAQGCANHPPLS